MGRQGIRFPISAIAVVGLGALVALAVGVSLYLGLSSATENTRRFMAHRAETLVDGLEQRIASELRPVVRQARWTVEQVERGRLKLDDSQALDAFVRGTLGVTPQVAEIGITSLRGPNRRWGRESAYPIIEDWYDRPAVAAWLDAGASSRGPTWHAPFWSRTLGATVLLLDTPIRIDGEFAGVFSQAVTISKLSLHIASVSAATGAMPFILYDRNHVLAHPLLISWAPEETDRDHPLVALNALGDAVLERIWTPEQEQLRLLGGLTATRSSGATVGDDFYVYLYRDIERYGPKPWTIGVYRSVRASDTFEWLADVARSVLSGSFDDSGLADGGEVSRVVAAVLVGITVLVVSVALAAWIGARASRPLRALAAAARSVESGRLERVPALPPSRVAELDDVNRSFNGMVAGLEERELIRETLGRFVPTDIARSLLSDGGELTPEQSEATVLFCDLEGFTALTESLGPAGIVDLLNEYFEAMVGNPRTPPGGRDPVSGRCDSRDVQRAVRDSGARRQRPAGGS